METAGGHKVIEHGGGIEGFNTELAYYPDDKLTVVVLGNVNGGAPGDIARKLAAIAHGETVKLQSERKEITLDPKVLARYVGAYQMAPGVNMLITLENNQLIWKLGNQKRDADLSGIGDDVLPESGRRPNRISQGRRAGKADQMILHQNGRDQTAKRLDDAEFKRIADAAAAVAKRFKDQNAGARERRRAAQDD